MPEGGGHMRCARCHTPACYTARKHTTTFGICLRHHQHVAEPLIRDGWIVAPVSRPVKAHV